MDNKGIHPRSSPCDVDDLLSEGFVAEGAEMTKSKNTTVLTIVATQRWEQPRSIQVQPDTGVDKLCLINTTYPPPYPAGLGWIRSLPRTKAPLLFPMFWLQEAKEHVPRQHCLALAAEAAGAQAFDAAQVVGHFAAVSERSPFGFILTRKHCAARSAGS